MVTVCCSGNSSVFTGLNIVAKVTPKPLTGPKKLAIDDLTRTASASWVVIRVVGNLGSATASVTDAACQDRHRTPRRQMLARHRGHRESTGIRIEWGRSLKLFFGLAFSPLLLIRIVVDERAHDHDDRTDHDSVDELLAVEHLDRRLGHNPHQVCRDQHLPAELHELVVAQPRQRSAQPDEYEQDDEQLDEEPQERPPP